MEGLVDKINKMKKRDKKMMKKVMNAGKDSDQIVIEDHKSGSKSPSILGGNSNSNPSNGSWTDSDSKEVDSNEESEQISEEKARPVEEDLEGPSNK